MSERTVMPALKIDPEFQSKIPPLTDAEYEQLKENILNAGEVFEPIVVWNGTIVDGHNRYKIVQEHPEIKWRTREMNFANTWEAIDWMCKNQLGRRNLTDVQITILRGKMYEARKHKFGAEKGGRGNQYNKVVKDQKDPLPKSTAEILAKELGVSEPTIKRSEKFAKGFDAIQKEDQKLASEILSGKKSVNKSDVIQIANAKEKERPDMIQALKEDKKKNKILSESILSNIAELYDTETKPEYTIDMFFTTLRMGAERYTRSVENDLKIHHDLLTDKDNMEAIINTIQTAIIDEMNRIIKEVAYETR